MRDLYLEEATSILKSLKNPISEAYFQTLISKGKVATTDFTTDKQRYFTKYGYLIDKKIFREYLLKAGFTENEIDNAMY